MFIKKKSNERTKNEMDNYSLSDLRAAVGDDNGAFGGNSCSR